MSQPTFKQICATAAAVRCLNAGQTLKQIAQSAQVSPATIQRWLRDAGFRKIANQWTNL